MTPETATAPEGDWELGRTALLEITSAESIGERAGSIDEGDGVSTVYFDTLLSGYPGWRWTVSIAHLEGESPSVLETELTPGDTALLSPAWVPWVDRLAEYKAAQEALGAEASEEATDDDEDDDDDDDDDLGSDVLHGGDVDGVDIDDVDIDDDIDADDDADIDEEDIDDEFDRELNGDDSESSASDDAAADGPDEGDGSDDKAGDDGPNDVSGEGVSEEDEEHDKS